MEKITKRDVCELIEQYCRQANIWGCSTHYKKLYVSFGIRPLKKKCKECGRDLEE